MAVGVGVGLLELLVAEAVVPKPYSAVADVRSGRVVRMARSSTSYWVRVGSTPSTAGLKVPALPSGSLVG